MAKHIAQAAAVAVKAGKVCLVTASSGKKWVVPKGCLEPRLSKREVAKLEAWEEAGICGKLDRKPIGTYCYEKSGSTFRVTVYLMRVTKVVAKWPERSKRHRVWVRADQAHERVKHPQLRSVLREVTKK